MWGRIEAIARALRAKAMQTYSVVAKAVSRQSRALSSEQARKPRLRMALF